MQIKTRRGRKQRKNSHTKKEIKGTLYFIDNEFIFSQHRKNGYMDTIVKLSATASHNIARQGYLAFAFPLRLRAQTFQHP